MSIRDDRRADALGHIARHLLDEGLPGSSLRSLAAAAGVSDRMLLYYFADKNDLLKQALGAVATQMGAALDQSVPQEPKRASETLLGEIRTAMRGSILHPYMRLWLEIASLAGRHEAPYVHVAGVIADGFANWISSRLAAAAPDEAARLLAVVEGLVVLDAVGRSSVADAAARRL
jgi:AcrR family transcriptional regulator